MAKTRIETLHIQSDGVDAVDLAIVPVAAGKTSLPEGIGSLHSSGPVRALLQSGDFAGKLGETALVYGATESIPRALLVGVGEDSPSPENLRQMAAAGARAALSSGAKIAAFQLPIPGTDLALGTQVTCCAEGVLLGSYEYAATRKQEDEGKSISQLTFVVPSGSEESGMESALRTGGLRAEGTNFSRDLGHAPANLMTPTHLAAEAERISKENGYECIIIEKEEAEKLGMGAFLGVSQGSAQPPKMILLRHDCGDPNAPTLGLIGKGITFDTGGISIKPSARMEEMKYDMCGAAAVMGAMSVAGKLNVPIHVVAAIAASENMPGAAATKPGDVHRSFSGKTIEVINTDAEGRLVMADALSYVAATYKPDALIDIATLTGAIIVALGHYGAGVMSNDTALWSKIEAAGELSGERVWRLPIWDEMKEHLKTPFADVRNIADPSAGGGSLAAAAFLEEFVGETPWAHIDIAGTAWWSKDRPHIPKGASGYGARLLLDLMGNFAK